MLLGGGGNIISEQTSSGRIRFQVAELLTEVVPLCWRRGGELAAKWQEVSAQHLFTFGQQLMKWTLKEDVVILWEYFILSSHVFSLGKKAVLLNANESRDFPPWPLCAEDMQHIRLFYWSTVRLTSVFLGINRKTQSRR